MTEFPQGISEQVIIAAEKFALEGVESRATGKSVSAIISAMHSLIKQLEGKAGNKEVLEELRELSQEITNTVLLRNMVWKDDPRYTILQQIVIEMKAYKLSIEKPNALNDNTHEVATRITGLLSQYNQLNPTRCLNFLDEGILELQEEFETLRYGNRSK